MKLWEQEEMEKKRVTERLQLVSDRMTAFYNEATPGKALDFYRMLRPSGGVDWWSDENVEVE